MTYTNFTLSERARYVPASLDIDALVDLAEECEAWRGAVSNIETPAELAAYIEECADPDQKIALETERDQFKEFFETVVNAMEDTDGTWPCAEPWDGNLQKAICDDIRQGAEAIRLIESFLAGDADREDLQAFFREVTGR